MNTWSIGQGESQRLSFVLAPENANSSGYEWLSASVKIRAGAFSGHVDLSLLYSDLVRFHEQLDPLYRKLHGNAQFRTLERQVEFDVSVDRTGHIEVKGALMDMAGDGNTLNFVFRFDQTDLSQTLKDLTRCIQNMK